MRPSVYLETTIPSYLTAWPSRDQTRAKDQRATHDWWATRAHYDLFVSQLVLDECGQGDVRAAADRLASLVDSTVLATLPRSTSLARTLTQEVGLPEKAANDALHLAIAALAGMDYFLTWNCRHIANQSFRPRIEAACRREGFFAPRIVTLRELLDLEILP